MYLNARSAVRDPLLLLPVILVVIALPFFFIGGPTWMSGPLFRAVWNLGHIVFFASLLLALQRKYSLHSLRSWFWVSFMVFLVGGFIEYLQTKVGRDGDWGDVLRNLTGAWLGLFWYQKSTPLVWVGRIAASILLALPLFGVGSLAWSQYQAAADFPLIAGFEKQSDFTRWDGHLEQADVYATERQHSAKIFLNRNEYSAAALRKFFGDWTGYHTLAFDIYNPDQTTFSMTLRVHDAEHELYRNAYNDRFNTRFIVEPGWNHYQYLVSAIEHAPRGRRMDMTLIRGIEIFATRLQESREIYLDNIHLEADKTMPAK